MIVLGKEYMEDTIMNSNFLETKKLFRQLLRKYLYVIALFILIGGIIGMKVLGRSYSDYISITETRHVDSNTEGNDLVVSLYTYTLSNGKMDKVYEFPLTAQYSLGVVDLFHNLSLIHI